MLDLATRQQPANLGQLRHDSAVRIALPIALLGLFAQDAFAAKERQVFAETAVVHDVVGDDLLQHPKVTIQLEFLHAVGWGAMHKPSAFVVGHKIGGTEITQIIPFAV